MQMSLLEFPQVLVEKCVNPETRRPYTYGAHPPAAPPVAQGSAPDGWSHPSFWVAGVLERALRATHFNVDVKRSAKQQALELLPRLQASFPIERAAMRFRLQVSPTPLPAPCASTAWMAGFTQPYACNAGWSGI